MDHASPPKRGGGGGNSSSSFNQRNNPAPATQHHHQPSNGSGSLSASGVTSGRSSPHRQMTVGSTTATQLFPLEKKGWLEKFSVGRGILPVRNWQKRYFTISHEGLNYAKAEEDVPKSRTFVPFIIPRKNSNASAVAMSSGSGGGGGGVASNEVKMRPVFLLTNVGPNLHPEAKDTTYYYFGLRFEEKGKAHVLLLRTHSAFVREDWVRFLSQFIHVGTNTGVPVQHPLDPTTQRSYDPEDLDVRERRVLKKTVLDWDEGLSYRVAASSQHNSPSGSRKGAGSGSNLNELDELLAAEEAGPSPLGTSRMNWDSSSEATTAANSPSANNSRVTSRIASPMTQSLQPPPQPSYPNSSSNQQQHHHAAPSASRHHQQQQPQQQSKPSNVPPNSLSSGAFLLGVSPPLSPQPQGLSTSQPTSQTRLYAIGGAQTHSHNTAGVSQPYASKTNSGLNTSKKSLHQLSDKDLDDLL